MIILFDPIIFWIIKTLMSAKGKPTHSLRKKHRTKNKVMTVEAILHQLVCDFYLPDHGDCLDLYPEWGKNQHQFRELAGKYYQQIYNKSLTRNGRTMKTLSKSNRRMNKGEPIKDKKLIFQTLEINEVKSSNLETKVQQSRTRSTNETEEKEMLLPRMSFNKNKIKYESLASRQPHNMENQRIKKKDNSAQPLKKERSQRKERIFQTTQNFTRNMERKRAESEVLNPEIYFVPEFQEIYDKICEINLLVGRRCKKSVGGVILSGRGYRKYLA